MADLGAPVALDQDDIEDAYFPFGNNKMLAVAFRAVHAPEAVSQPAFTRHNPPRYVVAGGRLVAESTSASTLHLG